MVQLKLLNAYFQLWKTNWQARFRRGWLRFSFLLGDPEFMMTADDKRFSKMYKAMTPAEQNRLDKAKGDGYWAITKQMQDKYKI
ncbi:MAG: hypothetical protein AB8G95_05185 [Anaerolineae bacterium]